MKFSPTTTYPTDGVPADELETIEFANAVRAAGGGEIISALMPSSPGDASSCLIANALNFNCKIRPLQALDFLVGARLRESVGGRISEFKAFSGIWSMAVTDHAVAVAIGAELNLPVYVPELNRPAEIALPACFGEVASRFDSWEGQWFDTASELRAEVEAEPASWVRRFIHGYADEGDSMFVDSPNPAEV